MRWKRPQHNWWLGGCLAGLLIAILAGGFSLPLVVVFVCIFGAGAALIALGEPAGETFATEPNSVPYLQPPEEPEEQSLEDEAPADEGAEDEAPADEGAEDEAPADEGAEDEAPAGEGAEGPEEPADKAPESPEDEDPEPASPSVRPSGDASPT